MFNNRFNNRNADPLVEAVKAAQADGDMRRAAIAQVNEAFGVYSRNAVIRENLAAYDAAIEEAYNCIKEGEKWEGSKEDKDEDKKLAKKHGMTLAQWEKSDADKKHDKKEKDEDKKEKCDEELSPKQKKMAAIAGDKNKIDAADLKALRSGKKMEEKKDCMYEGLKGRQHEIDANKNNKIDGGDFKILRARKKIHEKKMWQEGVKGNVEIDYSAPDRAAVTSGGKPATPAQTTSAPQDAPTPPKRPANLEEITKRTAISAYREKMAQDRDTKKLGDLIQNKWGRETAKHAYRAGHQDTVGLTRRGESHGTDRLASAKSSSEMRKTKSGKIHKQDVASKKSEIKFRGKMSKFDKKGHLPEEALDEATKKHFIAHAADIAKISDQGERNKAASAAADTYARLNKRFDHAKFHKAAGSTAHETQTVKESVLAAVRAKYMREMVVQKSQMRPGETLGQTMNRLQGKTAIKGGANDPSSPSFKGPKPAATASSSSGGDTGYKSDGGRTVSLKPTADSGTAQAAEPAKAAPTPAAQPKGWSAPKDVDQSKTVAASGGAAPADKPDTRTPQQRWDDSRSATNTPAPGVASRTSSAEVASGATAAKQSSDSVAKLMKMNESVQVGANKYRIV